MLASAGLTRKGCPEKCPQENYPWKYPPSKENCLSPENCLPLSPENFPLKNCFIRFLLLLTFSHSWWNSTGFTRYLPFIPAGPHLIFASFSGTDKKRVSGKMPPRKLPLEIPPIQGKLPLPGKLPPSLAGKFPPEKLFY